MEECDIVDLNNPHKVHGHIRQLLTTLLLFQVAFVQVSAFNQILQGKMLQQKVYFNHFKSITVN